MDDREKKAIIESILFTWGDPLSISDIANILELKNKEVRKLLDEMINEFEFNRRGIKIVRVKDKYQLCTRPEHYQWISKLIDKKENKGLSNAALETLAIIAYRQPITKSEIESIRGVRCDKAINTLINKNLIKEMGRLERTGKPIIYGTTDEFLRYFGLEDLKDLPELDEFNYIFEDKEE
ncbi:MAG: SMC-Scp complex subunit ScpB [Tissierellia bacterium]|nr:SMC-Scp complex subunit ScpB [Tissierellia bacterium]